ncbi:MAG: chromosome segregation protein SMC [Coxiellaceae bacterium]|nr:chromosome segregation protein SMC [Coxiellaceae bacterium]
MQLKRIQLYGFKSFVDATSIPVLSNMNAIVGPNGCGKSNIVDAIRWVTGETSAKQLRGQSMSDVIFNGTTTRKPVGKAAVELTFDNSDHRITGEYAAFTEISIRREVVRDGQSSYFINGVPARRRDLIDLFLGTGLGPRSYAIIEQGMISQLVEAKPEDMRTHLEEVAGISKYRERRRETENRIQNTNDNLARLNDLQEELAKQLRHLQRQANAAEQYKVLQQELRLLQAQMKVLQWQQFETQLSSQHEKITSLVLQSDAKLSEQSECETAIEKARLQAETLLDEKNERQKKFYEQSGEIGRLEQQIQHKQEQLKQWEQELAESESLFLELSSQSAEHTLQIETLTAEIEDLQPQSDDLQAASQQANHVLQTADQVTRQAQSDYDRFLERLAKTNQQVEIAKNNIRHYEVQRNQLSDRKAQIESQLAQASLQNLSVEIDPLHEKTEQLKEAIACIQETLLALSQHIQEQRNTHQSAQQAVSQQQGDLQKLEAQFASMSALQKAALQDKKMDVKPWLDNHGFSEKPRLGELLQVEAGWELAVETLLADQLDAICVDTLSDLSSALTDFNKGQARFLEKQGATHSARLSQKTIAAVISTKDYLPSWLSNVYVAENLAEAFSLQSQLQAHESIMTREGCWLGANWLQMSKSQSTENSFLLREKQLKQLQHDIQIQKEALTALQQLQTDARAQLEQLEARRDLEHRTFQQTTAQLTETQTQLSAKRSRLESLSQQQQRLNAEMAQIESQLSQNEAALQEVSEMLAELSGTQEAEQAEKDRLNDARHAAESALNSARTDAQAKKQAMDEWHIRLSSNERQLSVLTQTLQSNEKQLLQLGSRREQLQSQLCDADLPLQQWNEKLQIELTARVSIESSLREADLQLQAEQHRLKELESMRDSLAKLLLHLQEQQQTLRMDGQEMRVRQKTLKEQIIEMQMVWDQLVAELPAELQLPECEARANTLQAKIDRLGPINLAAIDEFKTVSERKTYLDAQVTDLQEALEVLQNAIRKIDRETRHLFKETFDQVNSHFQRLFPRIFNGGQASLELTDEDLLTTGILVKAQPPGKRNATIHMLSGGEKTLTAISLMFAMFQLNPAPFCVLDEVDAPLDDLNVGRYCQLVKEMSKDTQFLIISHNKVTIESADHMMGVTMQEPGVSRIVSVDMKEAVALIV